jgi:hypothetical protein
MSPHRIKRAIRGEIANLLREQLIDAETYDRLMAQYPSTRWDFSTLGRWFLFFGALSVAAGVFILGTSIFELTLENLAIAIALLIAICFYSAIKLGVRELVLAKRAFELLGALAIIGITFTLGLIFSSGSGNWPALLLIDLLILLPLAYLLRNVLILVLNVIVFFTWFGGVTGYMSGWGAYFFGMNYPMRFLIAGLLMAGMSVVHRQAEQDRLRSYDGFFKVWLSGGIFFSEMALWLMSLFGNFGSIFERYLETAGELFFFNALWTGFNALLLWAGTRYRLRMLRGYAMTFLIIQGYTLYFWKIAGHLGATMATFVAGAATLALVFVLESKRRKKSK